MSKRTVLSVNLTPETLEYLRASAVRGYRSLSQEVTKRLVESVQSEEGKTECQ